MPKKTSTYYRMDKLPLGDRIRLFCKKIRPHILFPIIASVLVFLNLIFASVLLYFAVTIKEIHYLLCASSICATLVFMFFYSAFYTLLFQLDQIDNRLPTRIVAWSYVIFAIVCSFCSNVVLSVAIGIRRSTSSSSTADTAGGPMKSVSFGVGIFMAVVALLPLLLGIPFLLFEYFRHWHGRKCVSLSNAFRRKKGLPTLRWSQTLANIGRAHSYNMARGKVPMSHEGFDDRGKAVPYQFFNIFENVGFHNRKELIAQTVVDEWIKSPGHCKNLMSNSQYCGVCAVKNSKGAWYFTQLFAQTSKK